MSMAQLDYGELKSATQFEADLPIDMDGSGVGFEGGEEGHAALVLNVTGKGCDESPGVAAAAKVGMGADGADLGASGGRQAPACHRGETAGHTDSDEASEGCGVRAEWAGLGEVGEGDHLGIVGRVEAHDCLSDRRRVDDVLAGHLNQRSIAQQLPGGGEIGPRIEEERSGISLGNE